MERTFLPNQLKIGAIRLAVAILPGWASAQESVTALVHHGLDLSKVVDSTHLALNSEEITISPQSIQLYYQISNLTAEPATAVLTLPLPDLDFSDPDTSWSIAAPNSTNFVRLVAKIDQKPVNFVIVQSAHLNHKDVSSVLRQQKLSLTPFGAFRGQIEALTPDVRTRLSAMGIIAEMGTDQRGNPNFYPAWIVKTTASYNLTFAPGQTLAIELRYRPSVGVAQDSVLREPLRSQRELTAEVERLQAEYCIDKAFYGGVDKIVSTALAEKKPKATDSVPPQESPSADQPGPAPPPIAIVQDPLHDGATAKTAVRMFPLANEANIKEWRIVYDLAAGAPPTPIKDFRLVVDKGKSDRIASLCLDNLKRISATAFELRVTDFTPNKALKLLLVGRE